MAPEILQFQKYDAKVSFFPDILCIVFAMELCDTLLPAPSGAPMSPGYVTGTRSVPPWPFCPLLGKHEETLSE